jgi:hypothetical protein
MKQHPAQYSTDAYAAFQQNYRGESDRGVVILAGSYLERALENQLKRYLVNDKSTDGLFEGYGPLSTFAAKIDVAFSVGLLTLAIRNELHRLRRIRNLCAHEDSAIGFSDERLTALCGRLETAAGVEQCGGGTYRVTGAREQVLFSIWWVLIHLEAQAERMSPLTASRVRLHVEKPSLEQPKR